MAREDLIEDFKDVVRDEIKNYEYGKSCFDEATAAEVFNNNLDEHMMNFREAGVELEVLEKILDDLTVSKNPLIMELREKIGLSRTEMSRIFDIPIRTIESWDAGVRRCSPWAEKLLVAELQRMLVTHYDDVFAKYEKIAAELGVDTDGNLAEVRWCTITETRHDQFIDLFDSADDALAYIREEYKKDSSSKVKTYGPGKRSVYAACALFTKGTNEMFELAGGDIYSDHDEIK